MTKDFVGRVHSLAQVQRVLVDESGACPRIWTVIRGQPFDRTLREPVYRAQMETLDAHPRVMVDFRLVNLDEYVDRDPDEVLPPGARLLRPLPTAS